MSCKYNEITWITKLKRITELPLQYKLEVRDLNVWTEKHDWIVTVLTYYNFNNNFHLYSPLYNP